MIKAGYRTRSIRARIRLLAAERKLPPPAIRSALKAARRNRDDLLGFADKHGVVLTWLFFGNLKSLVRMR